MTAILGIGTALPAGMISQDAAAAFAETITTSATRQAVAERRLATLFRNTTVRRRASVLFTEPNGHPATQSFYGEASTTPSGPTTAQRLERYATEAPALAARACRAALGDAATAPADIAHLVTISCTGFAAPGIDARLIESLGLPAGTARTHIGFMGCHAAINGLRIADAIVRASSTRVLLCAVELCSLHFQYAPEPGQAVANALFADGAAAAVLGPGADAPLRIDSFSSRLIPGTASDMTWTIGDHGFRMTLSPRVPELLRAHASPWVADWLAARSLSTSDIDAWAVHPGGPRILDAVASSLALPSTALAVSRATLADHGNMSSPTILFILDRLRREPRRGRTLAMAFGPGLMAEGVLLG